tara:strand:+ start:648 stop:1133 length:486 start_codon:yes stop_codon:yes gene_type:complete
MSITINGDGTIGGVSVGGLPDGVVDADTLAANAVTTAKISDSQITEAKLASDQKKGLAQAWINLDGTDNSIRSSFNVSSITDNTTGDYSVNFTTALADANFAVGGSCAETGSTGNADFFLAGGRQTAYATLRATTFVRVVCCTAGGAQQDPNIMSVVVHGN